MSLTEAKRSDVKMASSFPLNPGSIVALDRGYNDYALFARWTTEEVYFVTRLKDNAAYEVVEECVVLATRPIRSDQLIRFTGEKAKQDCPCLLRRVVVWDTANEQGEIVLLTNHLAFGSTTIAAIYKDRWEIELFFKALKQNLKVKSFVGTSENALRIQIWTALIALLLPQMASPSVPRQVVALELGFHAAYESIHLSRPNGLARQPLWYATHCPRILATYSGPRMI